tara:strand:- start:4724 stop:6598 length:1875 start_codon:yes stop_codon:yes gene_type:complete
MALQFSQDFEKSLSGKEGVRSDKIATTPLGVLIESSNRKDKKSFMTVLAKGDLLNTTIREINDNPEIKEKFGRFFEQQGKDKKTASSANKVLGSLQPFFEESGYLGPKGRNPVRIVLQDVIGTTSTQELFSTDPTRKVPSPYPFETYVKLKEVITGLLNSENKAERLAGTQLAMHVIGGYRPSDFKSLRIENINFKNGVVSGLDVKDKGQTSKKAGYFPKIIRDILLKEIGDPTGKTGLVFPTNNEEVINAALKKANIPTEYTTAGKVKQGVFTLEDTRKLNETHLTTLGYNEKDPIRLAATLRANKTTIGQYVATGAGGRAIEELFVKTSTPHVAFTGTTSHAQYLEDIGVNSSDIVKRYKVTNDVVERFPLDRVEEFQTMYPTLAYEDGDKVITSTLSQVNKGNAKLYQEAIGSELAKRKDKADIARAETAEEAEKARLKIADVKKEVKAEKKAIDLQELKNKGKNALDWITNNLGKPIKKAIVGGIGVELARQFIDKPLETGTAIASELLLERGIGTGPAFGVTAALQSSPAGEGSDIVRDTEQARFLQNMQNVVQADTNIQTDEAPRPQALNIIEQDTNIGNKMGTFGRTPDVSPGFVTPPSKSDLADETQRQQNFMGVT